MIKCAGKRFFCVTGSMLVETLRGVIKNAGLKVVIDGTHALVLENVMFRSKCCICYIFEFARTGSDI